MSVYYMDPSGFVRTVTDPDADRIFFWDDSAASAGWLTVGANLSIVGTTIQATGGGEGAGGYALIQDEGGDLTVRTAVNFTGNVIAAVDNVAATRTDVTVNAVTQTLGSGSELQYRTGQYTLGAVTDSVVSGGNIKIGGLGEPAAGLHVVSSVRFDFGSDAPGDIPYRSASGGLMSRIPLEAAATYLRSNGTIPVFAALNASDVAAGTLAIARGGTGLGTTPTNGQVLIGNGTNYTLASLTAGANITITPGAGSITIASSGGASGITALTGDVTASGSGSVVATLANIPAISGINLTNLNASNLASGTIPLGRIAGITNTEVSASAAIAYSKLAVLTVSRLLVSNASGFVSVSAVTSTEAGHLAGVTSAIQSQLDGKQASGSYSLTSHNHDAAYSPLGHNHDAAYAALGHTHTFASLTSKPTTLAGYGITDAYPTSITGIPDGNKFLRDDGSWQTLPGGGGGITALTGDVTASGTGSVVATLANIPAISGVNLTNLNASNLASGTIPLARVVGITNTEISASAAIGYSKLAALTVSRALVSDGTGFVSVSAVTAAEVGHLSGVTSAIQTQIDGKSATGHTHTFASLTSTPTTLAGYGITDAYPTTITGTPNGSKFLRDDGSWQAPPSGGISELTGDVTASGSGSVVATLANIPAISGANLTNLNASSLASGTVALARGGTGASLVDPAADRIMFWDDSAGVVEWLTLGTSLSITGTTINASTSASDLTSGTLALARISGLTNTEISASAAIVYSKLAALTISRALVSDGSGFVSVSAVTATELGHVAGVTSAIQTQIDGKSATGHTHTFASLTSKPTTLAGYGITDAYPTTITGTPNGTKFLRDDGSWQVPPSGGITALTGDVTASGSGSVTATLANIPAISGVNLTNLNASNLASGTVALARGGTGSSLTDPNADRIMFWDDSAGVVTWLTAGTNLTITNTTIDASFTGTVALANGGTGASLTDPNADRIMFWDDSAGAVSWLQVSTGLLISGTVLTATGSGAATYSPTAYTSNSTLPATNRLLALADATANDVGLTLPTAVGNSGLEIAVKRIDNSLFICSLNAPSGEFVDGQGSITLDEDNDPVVIVVSDGANWVRIR